MAENQIDQPLSKLDSGLIKEALLESVRRGAHGHMDPLSLAESMKAAFSLLDRSIPSEDRCTA